MDHMTCKQEVAVDPIFPFPEPDLTIQLHNFNGATMTMKGSLRGTVAVVQAFLSLFLV